VRPDNSHDGDWGGDARVREAVLRCAVAGTNGGSGLWWPEPMMEAACMHVWVPRRSVMHTMVLRHHIK
jgi:hypothetical protein